MSRTDAYPSKFAAYEAGRQAGVREERERAEHEAAADTGDANPDPMTLDAIRAGRYSHEELAARKAEVDALWPGVPHDDHGRAQRVRRAARAACRHAGGASRRRHRARQAPGPRVGAQTSRGPPSRRRNASRVSALRERQQNVMPRWSAWRPSTRRCRVSSAAWTPPGKSSRSGRPSLPPYTTTRQGSTGSVGRPRAQQRGRCVNCTALRALAGAAQSWAKATSLWARLHAALRRRWQHLTSRRVGSATWPRKQHRRPSPSRCPATLRTVARTERLQPRHADAQRLERRRLNR